MVTDRSVVGEAVLSAHDAEAEDTTLVVEDLKPLATAGGSTRQGHARPPPLLSPDRGTVHTPASGSQGGTHRAVGPYTRGRLRVAAAPYAHCSLAPPPRAACRPCRHPCDGWRSAVVVTREGGGEAAL